MQAAQLFDGVANIFQLKEVAAQRIEKIEIDSRQVGVGDLFVCLKGGNYDGHQFARDALEKGAKIIVCEHDLGLPQQVIVPDSRSAYSLLCKNFYQKACEKLKIIAITGTNGKTTVSHLCGQIFKKLGHKVGVIGTLGAFYDGKQTDARLTTPDPDTLHKTFLDMLGAGVEYVFMEASAHAIALKKLDGIKFETVVLTNITQDHLDFFGTMDNYAKTKLSLIDKSHCKCAAVCADDRLCESVIANPAVNVPVFSYGMQGPCDCIALQPKLSISGSKFYVKALGMTTKVDTQLVGRFNIQNILAATLVSQLEKLDIQKVGDALREIKPIEGRFNVLTFGGKNVVIDYAHTPDGLENLLKTVKQVTDGKVITLFGCGGNRDKLKRPVMGRIASKYSNHVILTSDNPRFEEPLDIIKDIEKGVTGSYQICENRADAIRLGLDECQAGDVLVIAGKGAEKYQEICGQKLPFGDFEQVYNYFSLRKDKLGDEND